MANLNDVVANQIPALVQSVRDNIAILSQETNLVDMGAANSQRITNDTTSKAVTVPADAVAFVCIAEGGDCRLEIDAAAGATSTLFIPENGMIEYPIDGGTQTLFCYGAAGSYGNFRFLEAA